MGIEPLKMTGQEFRNPGRIPTPAADHGQHRKEESQILHPPEIEGNLNGQRTKEDVEQRRPIHHQCACLEMFRKPETEAGFLQPSMNLSLMRSATIWDGKWYRRTSQAA